MSNSSREILGALWRGGEYAYLWTDEGKESRWFNIHEPTAIPGTWKNRNTYFGIHPCAEIPKTNAAGEKKPPEQIRSQIRYIASINCVFGEFDAKDEVSTKEYAPYLPDDFDTLSNIAQKTAIKEAKEKAVTSDLGKYKQRAMERIERAPLAPTLIIDSGGGYHVYWMLKQSVKVTDSNRVHVQEVQAAWVDLIGCDPVSKDLARVLRVPGTKNVKPQYAPDFPTVTVILYEPERLYSFQEIELLTGYDEVTVAAREAAKETKRKDRDKPTDDVITEFNRTHRIVDMLVAGGYTLGWEKAHMARLARPGRTKEQTSVIVFKDGEKEMSYHHSSSDPLYTIGHCRDAFDIETMFHFDGDTKAAYETTKRAQGKWVEARENTRQAVDPETGEILPLSSVEPQIYTNGYGQAHGPEGLPPARPHPASGMPTLPPNAHIDESVADGACQWLDDYIRYSRIWSPRAHDDFHESVGLWLLSTIAARRVALNLGKRRFASLYIALTSRTSVFAKSTTAEIAQIILKEAGLYFLMAPDDATPQAFVRSMTYQLPQDWQAMPTEQQQRFLQRVAFAAQKGWYFDEFGQKVSSMMREGGFMADFRGLLRKFDDTPEVYEYDTIGRGKDIVYSPYLALLVNLTPADLLPYAKKGSALWNDGFWARFAFITPPLNAERKNGRFPDHERAIPESLVKPLRQWHKRLGEPIAHVVERELGNGKTKADLLVSPPEPRLCTLGAGVYDAYYAYNDALLELLSQSDLTDLDGNYSRLPEKALRVAMLLASLENNNLVEIRHWARGQKIAETWRRNLHNLYEQVVSPEGDVKIIAMEDRILKYISEQGPRTIRELCQNVWGLDSGAAKIITKSLTEAGFLHAVRSGKAERYALAIEV